MKALLKTALAVNLGLMAIQSYGATFAYSPSDLLLGFRSSSGSSDFVVNLGQVSQYYAYSAMAPGSTITINAFDVSQLNTVFGSINGLSLSAFADVRTSSNPRFPQNTIWATAPRMDLNTQSDPWTARSVFAQGTTAGKIDGIANGAVGYGGTISGGPLNTATAISLPKTWNAGGGISYTLGIGVAGNFANTFPGTVEGTTASDFATAGTPMRFDLYQLEPGSGPGVYMGFFEFGTDGSLSYTTVPEPGAGAFIVGGLGAMALWRRMRNRA